jgi:hypothetical protein
MLEVPLVRCGRTMLVVLGIGHPYEFCCYSLLTCGSLVRTCGVWYSTLLQDLRHSCRSHVEMFCDSPVCPTLLLGESNDLVIPTWFRFWPSWHLLLLLLCIAVSKVLALCSVRPDQDDGGRPFVAPLPMRLAPPRAEFSVLIPELQVAVLVPVVYSPFRCVLRVLCCHNELLHLFENVFVTLLYNKPRGQIK